MKFSIVLIARNESKVLPRLHASLEEFQRRGGEVVLLDTGSSDGTADLARSFGFKVTEVGDLYRKTIDADMAEAINERFVHPQEKPIVKEGDTYFDFAAARNHAASLASNDMVSSVDADEAFTRLDIDAIDQLIDQGFQKFEYNFVFSHDEFGGEAMKFMQSKFYDRRVVRWEGIIHEMLAGEAKTGFLPEFIFKLEHWQNVETNRTGYLRGLAVDCYLHPEKDRNSHYFGRELFWCDRPRSAIRELARHIGMDKWPAERAQSMIFAGDCFGKLGQPALQVEWYHKAFYHDSSRREALIKLARFFRYNKNPQAAACYAAAALEIPWSNFYANDRAHYEHEPHEILYWAKGWMGDTNGARYHLWKALQYQPMNEQYRADTEFYYPKVSFIVPTLGRPEGLELCLESIRQQIYSPKLIEIIVIEDNPRKGVPLRVKEGLERATGEYIVFAANDMAFDLDCIINAMQETAGLVAFNGGPLLPDRGNICEHFMIRRDLVARIGGEIFDTEFHHVGVDNLLWAKCEKLGEAVRCTRARFTHRHFSKGAPMDAVYEEGWRNADQDRALLTRKLAELYQ